MTERAAKPESATLEALTSREYEYGFVTEIETETVPKGLNEDIVRLISAKKNEPGWLLQWRLKAFHNFVALESAEPRWAKVQFPPIDYQDITYYAAPKSDRKSVV